MLNRKNILFLLMLGASTVKPMEVTTAETFEEPVIEYKGQKSKPQWKEYTIQSKYVDVPQVGTYTVKEDMQSQKPASSMKQAKAEGRTKATKKAQEKADVVSQLQGAQRSGTFCYVAAQLGRSLRALPKSRGPITRKSVSDKCGNYFLGENEDGKEHPQAYAAVTNLASWKESDVKAHFNKAKEELKASRSRPGSSFGDEE